MSNIHFEDFSGKQFERLVLAYFVRTKPNASIEWYGEVGGDGGRDILITDYAVVSVVQCKNLQKFAPKDAKAAIDELLKGGKPLPNIFHILCGGSVSAGARDKAKEYATEKKIGEIKIWSGAEFEANLRNKDTESILKLFWDRVEFPDTPDDMIPFLGLEPLPADHSVLPPPVRLPVPCNMPFRSIGEGRFVGRIKDIWDLHDKLVKKRAVVVEGAAVVSGVAGIGKTQLAIEYAHRFAGFYPGGVFWTVAERGDILEMISRIGKLIGLDNDFFKLPVQDQLSGLWQKMNAIGKPSLIVIDNFPESGANLQRWLPVGCRVATVVTTRCRVLKGCVSIKLECLSPTDGADLINSGERNLGVNAEALSEFLGGLPVALELTGQYINDFPLKTAENILVEIRKTGEMQVLDMFADNYGAELPSGRERQVAAMFKLSWDARSELEKNVLMAMSHLSPAPVPRRILRKALNLGSGGGLSDPLDNAISALNRVCLADIDSDGDPSAHRLVLAFAMSQPESANFKSGIHQTVCDEMKRIDDEKDIAAYGELAKLIEHAAKVAEDSGLEYDNRYSIIRTIGRHQRIMGRYQIGRDCFNKLLDEVAVNLDPCDYKIAQCQNELALVLQDIGDLTGAKDLLEKALKSAQANFPPGDHEIAINQSNLATVLKNLGDLEGARDLLEEALKSGQANYSPGHPSIAIRQSNLALVLKNLGDMAGAKDLLEEALKSYKANFPSGHPSIAIIQSNLATVLNGLGNTKGARQLLEEALESSQANFSMGHPKIAIHQYNLALVLKEMGEFEDAKYLIRQAYEAFLEKFGPDHYRTKIVKGNLDIIEGL